jgi:hypothetical protein
VVVPVFQAFLIVRNPLQWLLGASKILKPLVGRKSLDADNITKNWRYFKPDRSRGKSNNDEDDKRR